MHNHRRTCFLNECYYSDCSVSVLFCWTVGVLVEVGVLAYEFWRNEIAAVQSAQNKHLFTVTLTAFSDKCSFHLSHDPQRIYLNQKSVASIVHNRTAYRKTQTEKKDHVVYTASAYFPALFYPLQIYSIKIKLLVSLFSGANDLTGLCLSSIHLCFTGISHLFLQTI